LGKVAHRFAWERRTDMRWYNPKKRVAETVYAPRTDEDAEHMLGGAVDSWAFQAEYGRLRGEGMPPEQAMIFVGHCFRMWHLGHPLGGETR
jgi:hypothetical protein